MISNRLFGQPISGVIREKLEKRQRGDSTVNAEPNQSVTTDDNFERFNPSDDTPFIRMWASVKIIEPEDVGETYKNTIVLPGRDEGFNGIITIKELEDNYKGSLDEFLKSSKGLKGLFNQNIATNKIIPIYKKNNETNTQTLEKYVFKVGARDQIDYVRKIYQVGNYKYQDYYGTVTENDITAFESTTPDPIDRAFLEDTLNQEDKLFPQELRENPLTKPQAGITSVESETLGSLGLIKKTKINFMVHNYYDFDRIYNKYFLKPGATVFIDFGWLQNLKGI